MARGQPLGWWSLLLPVRSRSRSRSSTGECGRLRFNVCSKEPCLEALERLGL